ncbi:unnamed protein product, partial [Nippostrongylus brasiliensis]|uniref:Protein patched homolog 2 (inferred by orthology to a human protein) n=1 Tax=Nippostrongylus brasiliensis TaxID=27835 RepID=A0A0N4YP08_NIPBR
MKSKEDRLKEKYQPLEAQRDWPFYATFVFDIWSKIWSYCSVRTFVERKVIGNSDSADFTYAWKAKFSHAPTWCDADMSLQQIRRGVARGNRIALYARSAFQYILFQTGCFVQRWAWSTVVIGLFLYTVCCVGLKDVEIETDLVKLWVQ